MQSCHTVTRYVTYVHHLTQDPCRGGVGAGHPAHLRVVAVAHGGRHTSHCFHWSLIRTCWYVTMSSLPFPYLSFSHHNLTCLSSISVGHSLSLFNLSTVRAELAVVYTAMAEHPSSCVAPSLRLNALTIAAMIAVDRKLIDSRDFAECMPIFQALGGEVKDRVELLSTTAAQADTGIETDSVPAAKPTGSKRSRIEISEPNLNKSRKTFSNPSAGNSSKVTEMIEIVLDPETLSWSALLGPQGTYFANFPPSSFSACYSISMIATFVLSLSSLILCILLVIPSLIGLGCSSPRQATLCMVAVHECLRCMYDSELVIRAGALSALKRLCLEAGVWSGVRASRSQHDEGYVHILSDGLLFYLVLCRCKSSHHCLWSSEL